MKLEKIVNSIMTSVTYIISDEGYDDVWLVDCGDADIIMDAVGSRRIKGILLTHAHYDHIYGLPKILTVFPECKIYTNNNGKEGLASAKKNLSKYHDNPIEISGNTVCEIAEGKTIEIFPNVIVHVYETPGHNPSSICFEIGEFLFTGDAYIPGVKPVTNLPGGDKNLANDSVNKIEVLLDKHFVYAGHV